MYAPSLDVSLISLHY